MKANKKVVVIGGGPAGRLVVTNLYKYSKKQKEVKVDVLLIDKKEYGENTPAAVRAWIVPEMMDSLAMNLQEFFPKYEGPNFSIQTIVGEVHRISPNSVQIRRPNDRHTYDDAPTDDIPFDALVVASGTQYHLFKGSVMTLADRKEELNQWAARIANSNNVLIVGGGVVGVEIAGEILSLHPQKHLTIVQSGNALLPTSSNYTKQLALRTLLKFSNVKVLLGQNVDLEEVHAHGIAGVPHEYRTSSGDTIVADVAVFAGGYSRPHSDFFRQEFANVLTPAGYVKTQPTLQIEGQDNMFALGDIAHFETAAKLAANVSSQSDIVARNVVAQLRGSKNLPARYKSGWLAPGLITIGSNFGIMDVLNLFGRRPSGAWVSGMKAKFVFGKLKPTQWK